MGVDKIAMTDFLPFQSSSDTEVILSGISIVWAFST